MCGIAGIWNLRGQPLSSVGLDIFTDTLAHRGPDGRGIWRNDRLGIGLGHRRLAILDLSQGGRQPMSYAEDRYQITYNGEVYNFIELRSELERLGHKFASTSDTEVILAAFAQWREQCLLKFNGMWAFAIWDQREKSLFLARDRFGIKPLYYVHNANFFAFASELKSFRHLTGFTAELDDEVATILLDNPFAIEGSSRSLLRNVQRLQGGHYAYVTGSGASVTRWWRTTDHLVTPPSSLEEQAERFRELFFDSIALRMRSDVPIGTCLSGGFDSSSIVAAMSEIRGRPGVGERFSDDWQHAFIASFPGQPIDETPQALAAANLANVSAHFLAIDESSALLDIDRILDDFDDVYINTPTAPWLIYRELRRKGIVVSLDGHGCDELMGLYRGADYLLLNDAPSWITNPMENLRRARLADVEMAVSNVGAQWSARVFKLLRMQLAYHPDFARTKRIMKAIERGLTRIRKLRHPSPEIKLVGDDDLLPPEWGETNRLLYRMFHSTVLPTILRNFDRLSMAHGVEVRMPFMDWRLVTYVMSLPEASKIGGGMSKRVARLAMRGSIPEEIRTSRVKIGFNAPLPQWLNGPLSPWVNKLFLTSVSSNIKVPFSVTELAKLYTRHQRENSFNWSTAASIWLRVNLLHFAMLERDKLPSR